MSEENPSLLTDTNISTPSCITISDEDIDDPDTEIVNIEKCKKKKTISNSHICNICNKTFSKNCSLKTHYLIHAGVKPFICEVCYKTFSKKSSLVVHSAVHTGNRPFVCYICEKKFARKTDLQKHFLIHSGEKPYTCDLCEKSFNHQSNLRKHKITHTREKSHICDVCRQAFSHRDVLMNHLKNHYNEESVNVGKTTDRERLTIRNYLKTVIKKNFHACDKCDKSFIRSDRLKKHKLTHSTNIAKNHICEVCNAKFKTKENLQEHLLNHVVLTFNFDDLDGSGEIDDPNFNNLDECDIDPTPNSDVQPVENPKSDNTCSICFKTFSRKTSLRVHSLVHSGSKPHKCTLCEKTFAQKVTLKRHLQVHTGERPFTCEICKKNFARKTSLRKHYISHSAKKLF